MKQVDQDLEGLADDGVGTHALDVHDEAHAARIVLVAGVIKSLRGRRARVERHIEGLVIGYTSP
jgi:hypothetical protein